MSNKIMLNQTMLLVIRMIFTTVAFIDNPVSLAEKRENVKT